MRLDKFLTVTATATRSEGKKAARSGAVTVNGVAVRDTSVHIDEENDKVSFRGTPVVYKKFTYIMMNKPTGYISSTDDPRKKTVLELLPENLRRRGLFPCGRLDIDFRICKIFLQIVQRFLQFFGLLCQNLFLCLNFYLFYNFIEKGK